MDGTIFLAVIVFAPLVVLTLLRANAAVAFLALCLGSVLGSFVARDLVDGLRGYIAPPTGMTDTITALILLWLPVVLVAVFMMKTIAPKQRIVNALPALAVGLLGVLLTVPFLSLDMQTEIQKSQWFGYIDTYKAAIVVGGTIVSLGLLRLRKRGDATAKK